METHVEEGSPLSNYLEATGEREDEFDWPETENREPDSSPPPTPRDFAPRGLARVRRQFRNSLEEPTQLDSPSLPTHSESDEVRHHASAVLDMFRFLLETVTSSIDRARSIRFLERLRLAIIQSQLLENPLTLGYRSSTDDPEEPQSPTELNFHGFTTSGVVAAAALGFFLASLARWYTSGGFQLTWKRLLVSVVFTVILLYIARAYIQRKILRNIQRQALVESASFFAVSHDFDGANSAALNFIMEVELVARGYRLSTPIPPISRLEKNGQNIKCLQLRHAVRTSLAEVISAYYQIAFTIWGFAEQTELLQLQSQYQFTVADVVERFHLLTNVDAKDGEKLQALKDAAYLFHDIRKIFLSGLLALHNSGKDTDRSRFTTVLESFKELNIVTKKAYTRVKDCLVENNYQLKPSPKPVRSPASPHQDRWQHQLRRLSCMTMNIRSVQAKLHLLQEESNKALNEANDITEMGPIFLAQYDSIGQDLRDLMEAWQSGKRALQSGIDRNEKRISSIGSTLMASPTSTLSGQTIAGDESSTDETEQGVEDALRKLTGEASPTKWSVVRPKEPEVFEAVSMPRPKSLLTREERLVRMREERKAKENARVEADAYRGMMQELAGVLDKKGPRGRISL